MNSYGSRRYTSNNSKSRYKELYELQLYSEGAVSQKETCYLSYEKINKILENEDFSFMIKFIKIMRMYHKFDSKDYRSTLNNFKNICNKVTIKSKVAKYYSKKCIRTDAKKCSKYKKDLDNKVKKFNDCADKLIKQLLTVFQKKISNLKLKISKKNDKSMTYINKSKKKLKKKK